MVKIRHILFTRPLLLACLLTFWAGHPAISQQLDNPVIGIVDVQRVLQDAKAAKSVLPEFEKLRKTFQQQVRDQEKTLRDAEQQLSQQRAILSREAFTEKRRAFTEQAAAIQAQVQERRRELDESFNATKNVILQNLVQVAQEVAKNKNLNIVMEKRFVFISAKALDITDDILASLDKRLPVVSIQVPKDNKTQGGAKGQR